MVRAAAPRRTSPARGAARHALGRWGLAAVGSALLGVAAATAVQTAPPAQAYWTDTGTVTSGTFTTWALTGVSCPNPAWGSNQTLSWTVPSGTTSTVTLTVNISPSGLSSWATTAPRAGTPLTTTGTQAQWGITTSNLLETTAFSGTWTLLATAPGGVWTATRTGTWSISFTTGLLGTATCSVS